MSYSLHVVKRVEKMAPLFEVLNHKEFEFGLLLDALGIERCAMMQNEDMATFEVDRQEMKNGLRALKNLSKGKPAGVDANGFILDENKILKALKLMNESVDEMITIFRGLINKSDKKEEYITLWWF